MYCICCKKNNVKPMGIASEEDLLWKNEKDERSNQVYYKTIESEMVDNGTIDILNAGYGSKHDGERILLAICDDCIKENLADGTLLYFSNYMTKIGVEDKVEKSKKTYQRRCRLDGLLGDE